MAHVVGALPQRVCGPMLPEIIDAICDFVEELSELDHESGTMPDASGQLVEMQPSQVVHDSIVAS